MPLQQPSPATAWSSASPAELVAAIERGDPAAEAQLVERFARGVAVVLDRHTGGRPEADDLYQETFAVALEKLRAGELREPERLAGFMVAIARNLAIAWYRKKARRKTDPDSDALVAVVSPRAGADAGVSLAETAALVREVLGELGTPRDREILFRFYIAEHDKDDICADLGLERGQFNRVLHRARERFRARLAARGLTSVSAVAGAAVVLLSIVVALRGRIGGAIIATVVSHGS